MPMPASTFIQRKAILIHVLQNEEYNLSFGESTLYFYQWLQYELSRKLLALAQKRSIRYANRLNQHHAVFRLRREIKDL